MHAWRIPAGPSTAGRVELTVRSSPGRHRWTSLSTCGKITTLEFRLGGLVMPNNPGRPLAPHVQAAIARGQGAVAQPRTTEVAPGRQMAPHVLASVMRTLQARPQAPSEKVAPHVQAMMAKTATAHGAVQRAQDVPRTITNPFDMPSLFDPPTGRITFGGSLFSRQPSELFGQMEPPPLTFAERLRRAPEPKKEEKRQPTYEELKAELRLSIQLNKARLEGRAKHLLGKRATRYSSLERTVCFMWRLGDARRKWPVYAVSGGSPLSRSERESIKATPDKDTTCAEEVFLLEKGTRGWLFSVAYDERYGWKRACSKGCKTLLETHGIVDLVAAFHW